jgi:hypothetical protein
VHFAQGKGNKPLMAKLGNHIAQLGSVEQVAANPRTGTVVIRPSRCGDEVISALEADKDFPMLLLPKKKPEVLRREIKQKVNKSLTVANKRVVHLSGGSLDVPSLMGVSLVGLALLQARSGLFLPAGLTMLLLAYKSFENDKI